jgi:hypothetical protein
MNKKYYIELNTLKFYTTEIMIHLKRLSMLYDLLEKIIDVIFYTSESLNHMKRLSME